MKLPIKTKDFVLRHIRMSDAQGYFECYQGKNIKQAMLKLPKNVAEIKRELKGKIADNKKKKPFDVSASGWDSDMTCYPSIITVKEKTYMFYNGNNNGETGFGYAELIEE